MMEFINSSYTESDCGISFYDITTGKIDVWYGVRDACPGIVLPYENELVSCREVLAMMDKEYSTDYQYCRRAMQSVKRDGMYECYLAIKYVLLRDKVKTWIAALNVSEEIA